MKIPAVVIAIVAMLHTCSGWTLNAPQMDVQFVGYGACPNVSVKDRFAMTRFKGKWYEQERLPYALLSNQKCVSYDIADSEKTGYDITVQQTNTWFNYTTTSTGSLTPVGGISTAAKMDWRYWNFQYYGIPFWVVDTDYTSYALVYSCQDYSYNGYGIHLINAWILSRDTSPLDASVLQALHAHITNAGIDENRIMKTKQDC